MYLYLFRHLWMLNYTLIVCEGERDQCACTMIFLINLTCVCLPTGSRASLCPDKEEQEIISWSHECATGQHWTVLHWTRVQNTIHQPALHLPQKQMMKDVVCITAWANNCDRCYLKELTADCAKVERNVLSIRRVN